jgi:predicted RNase H-like nuclease
VTLARDIDGVELRVPARGPLAQLKRYEDALDAVVCAWVGIQYLEGKARAYGDATSAVWA